MDDNGNNHHRMASEKITPRGKATPFLKLRFLSQHDRKTATVKRNAVRAITGYITSPVEPREVQEWLPLHKKKARSHIIGCLWEKGYKINDSNIFTMLKWRCNPFRFI